MNVQTFELFDYETKSKIILEAKKNGGEWIGLCPKHEDHNTSLSINETKKAFYCHGCGFKGSLYDPSKDPNNKKKISAIYDYQNKDGNLLFQVVRYEPKDFRQRRPDGNGGWIWNLEGIQTVLYRLPDILKTNEVIIVEGEKDVENLINLGFISTTSPMGAGKWREHYNEFLKDKDIILCPDNDQQGIDHMTQVAASLYQTQKLNETSLKWLALTEHDVSDWIATFQDSEEAKEEFAILIERAKPYVLPHDPKEPQELNFDTLALPTSIEISQLEIKVEWIVENLIPKESITLLHSIGGVGKSYLMYQLAKSVSDDGIFFSLNVKPMEVFYIDFENPLSEIADRMKKIGGSANLRIWHLGHNPAPIRFDSEEWEVYKTFPMGLFIVDSLRSSHLLDENSSKDASLIMARLKEIRANGSTIILIHHESKAGGYRGSTAWFDLSDHILKFSRVKKIGSDEDTNQEDMDLPIRLGLGGKSRFSSAMELKPMFFKFENQLLVRANDPDEMMLSDIHKLLLDQDSMNTKGFTNLIENEMHVTFHKARHLIKRGEGTLWRSRTYPNNKNKTLFEAINYEE